MSALNCGCDPDCKNQDGTIGHVCERHYVKKHDFDCPCTQLTAGEDGKVYSWPDECCTCEPPT